MAGKQKMQRHDHHQPECGTVLAAVRSHLQGYAENTVSWTVRNDKRRGPYLKNTGRAGASSATFFTPGWVAEQYPDKLKAIVEKGHEIAALGYHHEHMALLSEEEQESAIKKGIDAIEKVCGVTPKGFRSPEGELTLDTLRIAKKNGLVYSSNLCDDDRPYWKDLGEDKILEIPIHWVNYDLPYFAFNYHPAFPAGPGQDRKLYRSS